MTTFSLGDETYALAGSKLTFGEACAFEKVTGLTFAEVMEDERLAKSALATQALIWISMKRVKPETKFTDLDGLPIDDIEWNDDDDAEGEESEARPTPGEDSQPTG